MDLQPDVYAVKTSHSPSSRMALFIIFTSLLLFILVLFFLFYNSLLPCRGSFGRPFYTGIVRDGQQYKQGDDVFSAVKVDACVLSVKKASGTELIYEVGLFQNFFKLNRYSIRIGGKYPKVAVCNISNSDKCQVTEASAIDKQISSGKVYTFYLVVNDRNSQLVEFNQEYENFMKDLSSALVSGNNFPADNQIIQVSQVSF